MVDATSRLFYPLGKDPVQMIGCASGPVWAGAVNLSPTSIRTPGRSARSKYFEARILLKYNKKDK